MLEVSLHSKELQNAFGLINRFDTTKERISELVDVRNYPTETKKEFKKRTRSWG